MILQDILYKKWDGFCWKHDQPFVADWLKYPGKRVFTRICYDMYSTDETALRIVPKPIISRLPTLADEEVLHLMAPIFEYFDFMIPSVAQREYTHDWYANLLQNPTYDGKSMVGLILSGQQGEGKNIFLDTVRCHILGDKLASKTSLKQAFTKHTTSHKLKVMLQIDEIDKHSCIKYMEELKDLMTAPTVEIDEKYIPQRSFPNLTNLIMTTNNDETVQIPANERRMCIIDCRNKMRGNSTYWISFAQHLQRQDVRNAIYQYYFRMRDVSARKGRWQTTRPFSESYVEQQQQQLSPFWGFLSMLCEMHSQHSATPGTFAGNVLNLIVHPRCIATGFHTLFHDWMKNHAGVCADDSTSYTVKRVGMLIRRISKECTAACEVVLTQRGSEYRFKWAELKEYLQSTQQWDSFACGIFMHSNGGVTEPDKKKRKIRDKE